MFWTFKNPVELKDGQWTKWKRFWAFGYWTGLQKDLICIQKCKTNEEANKHLSMVSCSFWKALLYFIKKNIKRRQGNER